MTIKAHLLNKSYGKTKAVVDLSFAASQGGVLGLLGANGAGKSTLIKMLTGSLTPDSGDADIGGYSIVKGRIRAQSQIGYLPEAVDGFESLYVLEFCALWLMPRAFTSVQQILRLTGLSTFLRFAKF